MMSWFTSDHHFGHAGIIRACNRPFGSTEEMDAHMIQQWNARVRDGDEVWYLGDFSWERPEKAANVLSRLNGTKHLVAGNHDSAAVRALPGWASVQDYAEITVLKTRIVLSHYAMRTWNGIHRGALQLYGHSHGTLAGSRRSCDVGVDAWPRFVPVTLAEVQAHLATLPEKTWD
jgi:calcineurin-like phosphoesterase family protein